MDDSSADTTVLALTARVVAAHVSHNEVEAEELPGLIRSVYEALNSVGTEFGHDEAEHEHDHHHDHAHEPLVPAVPPEASVFNDYIICLEDGKKTKNAETTSAKRARIDP